MKALNKIILVATVILTSAFANAGDASDSKILGFSKDGKYFAYMQSGIQDGSGFFWTEVDVIDVANNKLIKRVYEDSQKYTGDSDEEAGPEVMALVSKDVLTKVDMAKYGISSKNMGAKILSRPYTDMSQYSDTVFSLEYWAQGGASSMVPVYSLNLKEQNAPIEAHSEFCYVEAKMITMELVGPYRAGDDSSLRGANKQVFQKDLRLPASRNCAYSYKVSEVILYQTSLVVLVNYQTIGFEGPNYRFMAVSGILK